MNVKDFEKELEKKLTTKKNRLIKAKEFLERYDTELSIITGMGASMVYMSNINDIHGGIAVQSAVGTVFVGCTIADIYLGTHILSKTINDKLETGLEEDIDYELYKNEDIDNKNEFNKQALVRKLKK